MSNLIPLDLYFNVRACGDQLDEIRVAAREGLAYKFKTIRDDVLSREIDPAPAPEDEMRVRIDLAISEVLDYIEENTDGLAITVKTKSEDSIRINLEKMGDMYWGTVNT